MKSKQDVYKDIEQTMGVVPTFFKQVPEGSLELEWDLMEKTQLEEGPIPNKYRELIGVGIAATTKCKYCIYFHTQMARLNGATDAEIEDAVHFAQSSAGWSAYLNGLDIDLNQFKREVNQACEHIRAQQAKRG